MSDESMDIYQSLCETGDREQTPSCSTISVPNMVRCPFYENPVGENQNFQGAKYTKRTQRHRSTAQSRLGDMTVGDIRYCFQQLRNAGKDLDPDMMLYNGQSAGEFALKYLRETSTAMRKRRKKLSEDARACSGENDQEALEETNQRFNVKDNRHRRDPSNVHVLEF